MILLCVHIREPQYLWLLRSQRLFSDCNFNIGTLLHANDFQIHIPSFEHIWIPVKKIQPLSGNTFGYPCSPQLNLPISTIIICPQPQSPTDFSDAEYDRSCAHLRLKLWSYLRLLLLPYSSWSVIKDCQFLLHNFSRIRLLLTSGVPTLSLSSYHLSYPLTSTLSFNLVSHPFHSNLLRALLRLLKVPLVQRYYNSIIQEHLEFPCYLEDQAPIGIQGFPVWFQHIFLILSSTMSTSGLSATCLTAHSCPRTLPHFAYLLFFSLYSHINHLSKQIPGIIFVFVFFSVESSLTALFAAIFPHGRIKSNACAHIWLFLCVWCL